MKARVIAIDLDRDQAVLLARIIRDFAAAAYPPGGSECAQVARTTLLDSAQTCDRHPGGALEVRRRQLPMLRSAVQWWIHEHAEDRLESTRQLADRLAAK